MGIKLLGALAQQIENNNKQKTTQTKYQKVDNVIRQRLIDNLWKPG